MINKNTLPKKLMPFIWHFLKKYKIYFILYVTISFILGDLGLFFIQPYLLKILFDKIDSNTINIFNGLFIILLISFSDTLYINDIITNILKFKSLTRTIGDIRNTLFNYSMNQSVNFFNNNYSGELVNKINSITETIETSLEAIIMIAKNIFLLTCFICVLFFFDKTLGFASIIWFVLYCLVSYCYLFKKKAVQSKLIQENQNKITAFVNDDFMNIKNIKIFASEKKERNILLNLLRNKFKNIYNEVKYTQISDFLFFILNFSLVSLILFVAIYQLKNSIISMGSFIFLFGLVKSFIIFAREICWLNDSFRDIIVMKNSLELITDDIELKDKKDAINLNISNGKIVFKNIIFKY